MITQDLGIATAYGYAKSKGYTGTEAEFAELMASYASTAQTAIEAADRAVDANTAAQSAKTDAAASKTAAQTAAQTATTKASEASQSASTATTKASEASLSASTASAAATSAITSAQTATTAAATATTKASEASESATTATTAKTDAETARDAAAQSASEAAASAESIEPDEFNHKIYAAFATDAATGSIASFPDGADSIPMKDVLIHIEPVQEGSGDPSPDNVRPISGWTEINAYNDPLYGGNIEWNQLVNSYRSGSTNGLTFVPDADNKSVSISGTITTAFSYDTIAFTGNSPVEIKRDGRRYIIICNQATPYPIRVAGFADCVSVRSYGGVFSDYTLGNQEFTNTLAFHAIEGDAFAISNFTVQIFDLTTMFGTEIADYIYSLELANVGAGVAWFKKLFPKDYYEYNAGEKTTVSAVNEKPYTHVTINLGQTVYGGFLHATSGVLTVDRAQIASYNGEALPSTWISDRDVYASGTTPTIGAQVVYKLASPITYTLTPQEIKTLLGQNNIWADTGNVSVEYRADVTKYIDRKITEAVSALT